MDKQKFIKKLEKYVKKNFYGNLHHGWPHMNRVRKYAKYIAEKEGADVFIVESAALLHDIAKIKYGSKTKNHAKKGAEMAGKILAKLGLDKETVEKVCGCIKTHSRRERGRPKTIEQKVLYDADGLELIGAVGILRCALCCEDEHSDWKDICRRVKSRLKDIKTFYTETGKKIAEKRIKLIESFYRVLDIELNQR